MGAKVNDMPANGLIELRPLCSFITHWATAAGDAQWLIGLRSLCSLITDWATAPGDNIKDAICENRLRPLITTHLSMRMQILPLGCHQGHYRELHICVAFVEFHILFVLYKLWFV